MKRICKQCGKEFVLTQDEIAFYRSKNLHIPKRCEKCRKENKAGGKTGKRMQPPAGGRQQAGKEPEESGRIGSELSGNGYESASGQSQVVRAYHGKENGRKKSWAVGVAVLILLAAVILGSRMRFMSGQEGSTAEDQRVQTLVSKRADIPEADDLKSAPVYTYNFRRAEYLQEHFEKHGAEFGYTSAEEYLAGANRVIVSPDVLRKLEAEDGDDVYYLESTNEFVIVSTDGYLRTYFKPENGKAYFEKQ